MYLGKLPQIICNLYSSLETKTDFKKGKKAL